VTLHLGLVDAASVADTVFTRRSIPAIEGTGMLVKRYLWLHMKCQEGQTMAEYAVLLGVITLAVVGVFTALAGGMSGAVSSVTSSI
jgi:Flp pilus assembly pilin Flp